MPKMTLACKTADLLALAIHSLNHATSPGQHALLSADERTSTLQHLGAAVQAAAKLAEVAHAEVLGGNRPDTEAREVGREAAVVETLRMKTEIENIAETGRLHAEREKLKAEAEKVGRETERAVAETERLKALAMATRSGKMRIDAETERTKAETEREKVEAEGGKNLERPAQVKAETERPMGDEKRVGKENKGSEKIFKILGQRHPRVLEMKREVAEWNSSGNEFYTLRGWAWHRDSVARIIIGAANDNELIVHFPADVLMEGNKLILHRAFSEHDGEDYQAIRTSYKDKNIIGPTTAGGEREIAEIIF